MYRGKKERESVFVTLTFGAVPCYDLCLHRYTRELDLFRRNQIGFTAVCLVNRLLGQCNQALSIAED